MLQQDDLSQQHVQLRVASWNAQLVMPNAAQFVRIQMPAPHASSPARL